MKWIKGWSNLLLMIEKVNPLSKESCSFNEKIIYLFEDLNK
jgi:hypothetical protein